MFQRESSKYFCYLDFIYKLMFMLKEEQSCDETDKHMYLINSKQERKYFCNSSITNVYIVVWVVVVGVRPIPYIGG